ncbi:hypothetical protein [Pontibacter ummariensis]|nr:hypothetical protein [Pontibacter ummariensis]
MIPQMYNSLRSLLLLFAVAPTMALAQHKQQAPCPDINLDLSGLNETIERSLANLKHLDGDLQDLKELGKMEHLQLLDMKGKASYDAEKRKVLDKTYKVNNADILNIENKFGRVHVNTWDKNEMRVKVEMVARAGSESKAQEILDKIKVMESREGKVISLRTNIEPVRISGNGNKGYEVNYTVYMPEDNALAVTNSFGDVYLASLKGKADVNVKYGALKGERLSNPGNTVKLAYGSGNFAYINGGNVDVAYADMSVDGTNGLQGSSKFSDFKIGSLGEELNMDVKYGSFKVDNVSKDIRRIALDSGFTPISLNFADNSAFNFDVNVQFADFKVDKSLVNITHLEKGHTSAEYKGKFGGTATPKGTVSVTSKYGDVKFTK